MAHCFSPWLNFRGGKGVATALGAMLALSPIAFLCALAMYGAIILVTKVSALGSLSAMIMGTVGFALFRDRAVTIYGAFSTAFIFWTHRENIKRLRERRENTFRKSTR